ncbi:TPA: hypothetical protein QDC06_000219 [Burkholderia cepacia]|nr:hypothetical protein BZY94_06110 [Burkholderia territorii]HDR9497034.1 hypothetical protein [Burkholderia cepacia]
MRVWGRIINEDGSKTWVQVSTDASGYNDNCYLTALCQALKLNLGESPFYANVGIPQQQTIMTQVFPDFYISKIQQQYAQYFASLTIIRVPGSFPPQYNVQAVCNSGAILTRTVAT